MDLYFQLKQLQHIRDVLLYFEVFNNAFNPIMKREHIAKPGRH